MTGMLAIMHALTAWDRQLFCWINQDLYWRPLADAVSYLANDPMLVLDVLLGLLAFYVWAGGRKTLDVAVWGGLAVLAANLLHNLWLKPFFNRPRPFMVLAETHLCAPLYDLARLSLSFPSTHSASAAALAVIAGRLDPRLRIPAWLFALAVGWGAIYSGGHYPLDVLAGYAVGMSLGGLLAYVQGKTTALFTKPVLG